MSYIIVNGKKVDQNSSTINPFDRGFTLGHGLFEAIYIERQKIPFLLYHWERLESSSELLGINLPFNYTTLQSLIEKLVNINDFGQRRGGLRVTITDGIFQRGILSDGNQKSTYTITLFETNNSMIKPMTGMIVPYRRNQFSLTSRVKSTSYLDNIIAKKYAIMHGFDEAILLNTNLSLAEGAISNVFIVKDKIISTPLINDGALPGIMRRVILNDLSFEDYEVVEKVISREELLGCDEVFITNAILGVKTIFRIDDVIYRSDKVACLINKMILQRYGIDFR